ncbi:hypothetical protein HKCCE2091_13385 [Rhodobacterales bacterium HKCCE2091]|nr:hypothetical protein [Rhodobacterales bacterium HKCCE2091]
MKDQQDQSLALLFLVLDRPGLAVMLACLVILSVICLYVLVFYVLPWLAVRAGMRTLERYSDPRDAAGQRVERTAAAKMMGRRNIAPLSSRGMNAPAERSLGVTVMRTTWGTRLSTVAFAVAAVAGVIFTDLVEPEWQVYLLPAAVACAILAIAQVFTYELRYDRDVLISNSVLQARAERSWGDLLDIRDEGHGTFRLSFRDGRPVRVPKYLVGMAEFLTLVNQRASRV